MRCEIVNAVLLGVMTVSQIVITTLFMVKSKTIKEIKCLPKLMIVMATISTFFFFVWTVLDNIGVETTLLYYISPAIKIIDAFNYGSMFRFVRLQKQLKASEENSEKIMASIQRSK